MMSSSVLTCRIINLQGNPTMVEFPTSLESLYEKTHRITRMPLPTENIELCVTYLPNDSSIQSTELVPTSQIDFNLLRQGAISASQMYTFYLSMELKLYKLSTTKQGIELFDTQAHKLELNLSEVEIPNSIMNVIEFYKDKYAKSLKPQKPIEEIETEVIVTNTSHTKYDGIISSGITKEALLSVSPAQCGILLRASGAYSKIDLDDLFNPRPKFIIPATLGATPQQLINTIVQYNEDTSISTILQTELAENHIVVHDLQAKVNMIEKYLHYFCDSIHAPHCYSEANRRIALDFLLFPAIAPVESIVLVKDSLVSIDAEHYMKELVNVPRVGNGPLDYFISFLPQLPPTIGGFVSGRNANEDEGAEVQEVESSSSASSSVAGGELSPTTASIIEAKADVSVDTLKHSLGQLFAQMLDGLNLPASRKRKRTGEEEEGGRVIVGEERFIKGMLSTAQQTMFFSMTKSPSDILPTLEFYGKYSVNFLPRITSRDSGLEFGHSIKREEIEKFVKAVYFFSRYDGSGGIN